MATRLQFKNLITQALLLSGIFAGLYTIYIHKGVKVCFVYVHVSKKCRRCKALVPAGPTD